MATSPAPAQKHLLNEAEAAAFLDVSQQTLAVWRSTGRYKLPFTRIGRSIRYKLADLEAFIESRTVTPGDADAGE